MFFSNSRYLKVRDYSVRDDEGREVTVKRRPPLVESGGSFLYQVKGGDRLDLLSQKFYHTPRKWWLICDANPGLMHPDDLLTPGLVLTIPQDRTI